MATVGYLNGVLTLSTQQFQAGLAKAQGLTQRFSQRLNQFGSFVASRMVISVNDLAGAALAAAHRLAAIGRESIATGEQIDTLAKRFNMTTDEIQRLQYAAARTNVDFEPMLKIMQGLTKFLGRQAGVSDLTKALRELQRIPNAAQRAARAQEMFGKSWADLLPLINGGEDAIASFEQAMRRKESRLISQQDVANLAAADDALKRMGESATHMGDVFTSKLAPAITAMADALDMFSVELQRMLGTLEFVIDRQLTKLMAMLRAIQAVGGVVGIGADGLRNVIGQLDAIMQGRARPFRPGADGDREEAEPAVEAAKFTPQSPESLTRGSQAAFSAITSYFNERNQRDPLEQNQIETNRLLEAIRRILGDERIVAIPGPA